MDYSCWLFTSLKDRLICSRVYSLRELFLPYLLDNLWLISSVFSNFWIFLNFLIPTIFFLSFYVFMIFSLISQRCVLFPTVCCSVSSGKFFSNLIVLPLTCTLEGYNKSWHKQISNSCCKKPTLVSCYSKAKVRIFALILWDSLGPVHFSVPQLCFFSLSFLPGSSNDEFLIVSQIWESLFCVFFLVTYIDRWFLCDEIRKLCLLIDNRQLTSNVKTYRCRLILQCLSRRVAVYFLNIHWCSFRPFKLDHL